MVLEQLFPEEWLEKRTKFAFLMGVAYSILGIFLANLLFPKDPSLVAVAFTSLLLFPELYNLFSFEEKKERKEKEVSVQEVLKDNMPSIKIYLYLFLGILLVYSVSAMFLPGMQVNNLLRDQLEFRVGDSVAGGAVFMQGLFSELFANNMWVLLVCFSMALLTGDGAIFLIVWNASLWGTIFGVTARNAAYFTSGNSMVYFATIMLIVLPHVILEALSYIMAAISGSVISKDVILEKFDSKRFQMVFKYNFVLLLLAIAVLILGAIVETYVLGNSSRYLEIVQLSYSG